MKVLGREDLRAATLAGTISEIGYGEERRYSPTEQRNCRAEFGKDERLMALQCLANHGYSGSPILVELDGQPVVVGILSAIREEMRVGFAAPASQFEVAVRELISAEARPGR